MRIAITGGIGSGKSAVLEIIRDAGYNTLSADRLNTELLSDPMYLKSLADAFPEAVSGGAVDRYKLSEIVFNDKDKLALLNSLAHPQIQRKIVTADGNVVIEVPLLIEAGLQDFFDRIIVVTADKEIRLKRAVERGGQRPEIIERIMDNQIGDDERTPYADYVIENNGGFEELKAKVLEVLAHL